MHGGNLTELAGSPGSMPAGATPAGILANQPVPANDQVNTALLDFLRS